MKPFEPNSETVAYVDSLAGADGTITPTIIFNDAKREDSPLHDYYEWDERKMALRGWIERSREILRAVVHYKVIQETVSLKVVGYIRDPDVDSKEQGYVSFEAMQGRDVESRRRSLQLEFARAVGALKRARDLAIAFDLEGEVGDLLARVEDLIDAVDQLKVVEVTV